MILFLIYSTFLETLRGKGTQPYFNCKSLIELFKINNMDNIYNDPRFFLNKFYNYKFLNMNEKEKLICEFMKWESFNIRQSLDDALPIINKIESLYFKHNNHSIPIEVNIYKNECKISYNGYYSGTIIYNKSRNKITAVYKSIVEFIKWYSSLILI